MPVLTFSQKFPAYHPKKGQPTYFVEQTLNCLGCDYTDQRYFDELLILNKKNIDDKKLSFEDIETFFISLQQNTGIKSHTIRNNYRIKQGELISPRCWFGKPYHSPQIIFYDTIPALKTWNVYGHITFSHEYISIETEKKLYIATGVSIQKIATNDGLKKDDFINWFKFSQDDRKVHAFLGQIICWNSEIKY